LQDEAELRNVERWVAAARKGDSAAFGELVRTYQSRVYNLLYQIVRHAEDAREIAQHTWLKAWNKLDTFKGESSFYSWVYRIATRTALDFLRSRKRAPEVEFLDQMDPENHSEQSKLPGRMGRPDEDAQRSEVMRRFQSALAKLPEIHRTALILREIEGMSYEEIADAMDCRIGTVMSRLFHARRAIQNHLKDLI
jgi:RNA polymerase sigma-70 factor, ECF subfamily